MFLLFRRSRRRSPQHFAGSTGEQESETKLQKVGEKDGMALSSMMQVELDGRGPRTEELDSTAQMELDARAEPGELGQYH